MASQIAREKAVQAWCTKKTENITMDVRLAEAFSEIIDDIWSKPWLGFATTEELLEELKARAEVSGCLKYKTTDYGTQ